MKEQAKIGVALGGGGLRGLAHIGVLQAMEEAQIPINALAGTSMGGIIAGLYAAGVPIAKIEEVGTKMTLLDLATPDPNRHGLIGHAKMHQLFADVIGSDSITFADLKVPTAMIAADLETGEMVVLSEGPLIPAMLATSAFPIVFGPVYHQGHWLVDGGVLNNLPFDIVRQLGADRVIGVNTPPGIHKLLTLPEENEKRPRLSPQSIFGVIARPGDWKLPMLVAEASVALTAALVNRKRQELCPPDLLLNITILNTGTFMADNSKEIVVQGRKAAMESMAALLQLRDVPLPPRWQRQIAEIGWRLRRAWEAYKAPRYPMFPARDS